MEHLPCAKIILLLYITVAIIQDIHNIRNIRIHSWNKCSLMGIRGIRSHGQLAVDKWYYDLVIVLHSKGSGII